MGVRGVGGDRRAHRNAVDPHFDVECTGTATDWAARVVETDRVAEEFPEVSVTKVSRGATFEFEPRKSLPLTVV